MEHVYNEHGFNEISVVTKRFEKTVLNNIKPSIYNEILGRILEKIVYNERAISLPHLVAIEKEIKQDAKEFENCKVQTTLTNLFSYSPA